MTSKKIPHAKKQVIIGYEETLKDLKFALKQNIPTLLIGETGVGKTSLIRHLAYENKTGLRRLNLNGQTTTDEFVGKLLLNKEGTYWQDGVLTDAMRNGYWLVLDELNAALPEILFVLHSLLDDDRYIVLSENDGEIVRPHEDFRIFATMNPSGRYAGTKELNKALLSRFPLILQIDFPDAKEEVNIITHYSTLKLADIQYLVKMSNDIRESYKKEEIDFVLSTRDLINCAVIAQELGVERAIKLNIINRCSAEDSKAITTIIQLYFGKGITRTVEREIDARKAIDKLLQSYLPLFEQLRKDAENEFVKTTQMIQVKPDANGNFPIPKGFLEEFRNEVSKKQIALDEVIRITKFKIENKKVKTITKRDRDKIKELMPIPSLSTMTDMTAGEVVDDPF